VVRKPARPIVLSRTALYEKVWSRPMSVLAREYGMSGNALAKICNRLRVPYPTRGHWSKVYAGKQASRIPLPAAPERQAQQLTLSRARGESRRSRTRLSASERRGQLVRIAGAIAAKEGVNAASMKRIAADAGISDTQAYNYFRNRDEVLVEIVRSELAQMRAARRSQVRHGTDYLSRVAFSTTTAVHEIAKRGSLLETLLSNPHVRGLLRDERRHQHNSQTRAQAQKLVTMFGTPLPIALGTTTILRNLTMRAGTLVAAGKISLPAAQRTCLAIVLQVVRDVIVMGTRSNAREPKAFASGRRAS
jgi:AcrR family transcriptional regulator